MNILLSRRIFLIVALVLVSFELSVVLSSSPQNIGPAGVLAWFGGLYCSLVLSGTVVQAYFSQSKKISLRTLVYWAIVGQAIVTMVALRSLGQLQWRDGLLILALTGLIIWYLRKYRSR